MAYQRKKNQPVDAKTLVVGIDIGKYVHWVKATVAGDQVKVFKIRNDAESFSNLLQEIGRLQKQHGCEQALFGMEPTGHYWHVLAYHLDKHKQRFVIVNPAHVKWARELADNSPLKSDPKDAGTIADLVSQGKYLQAHLPKGIYAHLRKLSAMRDQRVSKRSAHKSMLVRTLDVLFPEFKTLFCDLSGKTALAILRTCPAPRQIEAMGVSRLTRLITKASHKRLGKPKAEALLQAAKASVGVQEGLECQLLDLEQILDTLELLDDQVHRIEQQQKRYLQDIPYAQFLLSIKGIGPVSVASLIGEIGEVRAYQRAEELIKLAGLNLYEVSSGIHKGKRRITKRGRRRLRKVLYCASIPLLRHNPVFRETYVALRSREKPAQQAIIALCVKLLRILFALVKNQQPFTLRSQYNNRQQAA